MGLGGSAAKSGPVDGNRARDRTTFFDKPDHDVDEARRAGTGSTASTSSSHDLNTLNVPPVTSSCPSTTSARPAASSAKPLSTNTSTNVPHRPVRSPHRTRNSRMQQQAAPPIAPPSAAHDEPVAQTRSGADGYRPDPSPDASSPPSSSSTASSGGESYSTARDVNQSRNGARRSSPTLDPPNAGLAAAERLPIIPISLSMLGQVNEDPVSFSHQADKEFKPSSASSSDSQSAVASVRQLVYSARTVPKSRSREFTFEEEQVLSQREQEQRDEGLGILGVFAGPLDKPPPSVQPLLAPIQQKRSGSSSRPRSAGSSSSASTASSAPHRRTGAPGMDHGVSSRRPTTLRRHSSARSERQARASTPPSPLSPPLLPPGLSPANEEERAFMNPTSTRERSPLRSVTPAGSSSKQSREQSATSQNSFKRLSIALGVSKSQSCPPGTSLSELGILEGPSGSRQDRVNSLASSPKSSKDKTRPIVRLDASSLGASSPANRHSPLSGLRSRAASSPGLASLSPTSSFSTSPFSPSTLSVPSPAQGSYLSPSPAQTRTWRSTISATEFEQIAAACDFMELKRQEVIWELIETESNFVDSFKSVIEIFALPLKSKKGSWLRGVPVPIARLFDWASDIIYLHCQILQALTTARQASLEFPLVKKIADSFLPYVDRLEIYQPYLVRFEKVISIIDDLVADSKSEFGEFVRMQSALPECCGLSLASYLLKPVQRLMKYPLFFKQLVDLTPEGHTDRDDTVRLCESTDFVIRVMQEVKSREDEYETLKALQTRLRGMPSGFKLARRDRRLVHQGVLRKIHINDRDRILLEADARAAELSKGDDSPPVLPLKLSGVRSRPYSAMSTDSGSSSNPDDFFAFASPLTAYDSPTSISSMSGSDSKTRSGSQLRSDDGRPTSLTSMTSSTSNSDESTVIGCSQPPTFSASPTVSQSGTSAKSKRILKTKGKQTPVHVFVFSDLVILATKASDSAKWSAKISTPKKKTASEEDAVFQVVESIGVSRVLGLADFSGKTEHEHLIRLDLLDISAGSLTPLSLGSYHSLSKPVFLALPATVDGTTTPGQAVASRAQWMSALEQPCLFAYRSISPSSLLAVPITKTERLSAAAQANPLRSPPPTIAALTKSPGESHIERFPVISQPSEVASRTQKNVVSGVTDVFESPREAEAAEREERAFWRNRLETIKGEMRQRRESLSQTTASFPGTSRLAVTPKTRSGSLATLPVAMSDLFLSPPPGQLPPGADAPRRSSFSN
ncbi:hypothetical protein OIV83_000904 [Microbotryomycetes sp. JL201]|nr:hypothetical protein OIV83_000904 [Microbotryomycetes sp. JL201]